MSVSGDDLDLSEWSLEPGTACCESDVALSDLLSDVCASCVKPAPSVTDTEPPHALHHNHGDNWRHRKKKKRKNLTGWPNAKRALFGDRDPLEVWQDHYSALGRTLEASGRARTLFVAPFVPVVPGVDPDLGTL